MNGAVGQALAVLEKDLRAELRNRAAVNAILLFAVTALVVVGMALGPAKLSGVLSAALLWVVLFFAAFSGLAHGFLHEEETNTAMALRLAAPAGAVYAGKLAFNLLLLFGIALIVTPLYILMLGLPIVQWPAFVVVLVTGCLGLGAAATIVAAIIAKARSKGALYGALGFPILLPLLVIAVHGTVGAMADMPFSQILRDIGGLVSFSVMLITASALLFPYVWED